MAAFPITPDTYTPPTDQELLSWFAGLSIDQQAAELKKLDIIENTIPDIKLPAYTALLLNDGTLILSPDGIAIIKIDYLAYEVTLPATKINNFYSPRIPIFECILSGVAGFCIGFFLGGITRA